MGETESQTGERGNNCRLYSAIIPLNIPTPLLLAAHLPWLPSPAHSGARPCPCCHTEFYPGDLQKILSYIISFIIFHCIVIMAKTLSAFSVFKVYFDSYSPPSLNLYSEFVLFVFFLSFCQMWYFLLFVLISLLKLIIKILI